MAVKKKAIKKKAVAKKPNGLLVEFMVFGNSPLQIRVKRGTTLATFMAANLPKAVNIDQYEARVNDKARNGDYLLNDGDAVTMAPFVAGGVR